MLAVLKRTYLSDLEWYILLDETDPGSLSIWACLTVPVCDCCLQLISDVAHWSEGFRCKARFN